MSEIKLGWYRRNRSWEPEIMKVIYVNLNLASPYRVVIEEFDKGNLEVVGANLVNCYDYLGTELGEWVSPDDVKLSDLPIRARFRNHDSDDWQESKLSGFCSDYEKRFEMHYPFGQYRYCQVWRAKK